MLVLRPSGPEILKLLYKSVSSSKECHDCLPFFPLPLLSPRFFVTFFLLYVYYSLSFTLLPNSPLPYSILFSCPFLSLLTLPFLFSLHLSSFSPKRMGMLNRQEGGEGRSITRRTWRRRTHRDLVRVFLAGLHGDGMGMGWDRGKKPATAAKCRE